MYRAKHAHLHMQAEFVFTFDAAITLPLRGVGAILQRHPTMHCSVGGNRVICSPSVVVVAITASSAPSAPHSSATVTNHTIATIPVGSVTVTVAVAGVVQYQRYLPHEIIARAEGIVVEDLHPHVVHSIDTAVTVSVDATSPTNADLFDGI